VPARDAQTRPRWLAQLDSPHPLRYTPQRFTLTHSVIQVFHRITQAQIKPQRLRLRS